MTMKVNIPLEMLNLDCSKCPNFDPEITATPITYGDGDDPKLIDYSVSARCKGLDLCLEEQKEE